RRQRQEQLVQFVRPQCHGAGTYPTAGPVDRGPHPSSASGSDLQENGATHSGSRITTTHSGHEGRPPQWVTGPKGDPQWVTGPKGDPQWVTVRRATHSGSRDRG